MIAENLIDACATAVWARTTRRPKGARWHLVVVPLAHNPLLLRMSCGLVLHTARSAQQVVPTPPAPACAACLNSRAFLGGPTGPLGTPNSLDETAAGPRVARLQARLCRLQLQVQQTQEEVAALAAWVGLPTLELEGEG